MERGGRRPARRTKAHLAGLAAALILPASAHAAPAAFRAGAAEATFNPTYPVYMGGYAGGSRRERWRATSIR